MKIRTSPGLMCACCRQREWICSYGWDSKISFQAAASLLLLTSSNAYVCQVLTQEPAVSKQGESVA